jgi:hypothetical protein
MKLPVAPQQGGDLPPCFGKEWNPEEKDCLRCLCFSSCGEKSTRAKVDPPASPGEEALAHRPEPQLAHSLGETVSDQLSGSPMPPLPLLSVPEEQSPDEPPFASLGRELIRGIGKAIGWTVANWFDKTPLTRLRRKK